MLLGTVALSLSLCVCMSLSSLLPPMKSSEVHSTQYTGTHARSLKNQVKKYELKKVETHKRAARQTDRQTDNSKIAKGTTRKHRQGNVLPLDATGSPVCFNANKGRVYRKLRELERATWIGSAAGPQGLEGKWQGWWLTSSLHPVTSQPCAGWESNHMGNESWESGKVGHPDRL